MRILMLSDWLPPDFGAVGQYAIGFASDLARQGHDVTLVGFTSGSTSETVEPRDLGNLRVRRVHRAEYNRASMFRRAVWTAGANLALLWGARRELLSVDEVRFTGSPPYLLHFVMPLAKLLRLRTRYRITDFHPECMIALLERPSAGLRLLQRFTMFWRRRVDTMEVLGEDQRLRLLAGGVDASRIELRRDPSPVVFSASAAAGPVPCGTENLQLILYSGNWGLAHEHRTFVEGYARYTSACPGHACLWLNATGARLGTVKQALSQAGLPFVHTPPAPLGALPGILRAASLHLITLDDRFVGYVMPSKVYACIESRRPILFIGDAGSDVHLLCSRRVPAEMYRRVNTGDAAGVADAIRQLLLQTAAVPQPSHS